jgi:hypothetical protein
MTRNRAWILLALASIARPTFSQDDSGALFVDESSGGDLRRSEHSGLWPFYSRDRYDDGSTRTSSLFGAIRSEELANGDYRHRVLPFYSRIVKGGGEDRQLAIYPLLYLRRRSPLASHDIVLPLFASWKSEMSDQTLLWPFFHVAEKKQDDPFRFIPTLFSSGEWKHGSQQRFGMPYILDLFERSDGVEESAWTVGVLFPWGPPTRFGLSLAKSREGKIHGDWHLHVAPLFSAGEGTREEGSYYVHTPLYGSWKTADKQVGTSIPTLLTWWEDGPERDEVNIVWPIFRNSETPTREQLRVLPFYAIDEEKDGSRTDVYIPFALSRFRSGTKETATDLIWPLFHVSENADGTEHATRVLPFYDHSVDADSESRGFGSVLYRRHEYPDEQMVAQWFLFPFGLHERSPKRSLDWVLPIWFDLENSFEEEQNRTTILAPFYFSHELDKLTDEGWHRASERLHLWPFYGRHVSQPLDSDLEIDTRFTLAPFFRFKRTRNVASGEINESHVDAPWPILSHEWTRESWDFALAPVLYTGKSPVRSYFRVWPAISVERGPLAESGFFSNTSVVQWFDDDSETAFRVFPALFDWTRTENETSVTGPLWLTRYRDSDTGGSFHLFPIGFGEWDETTSEVGIFPLHYRRNFANAEIERWSLGRFFFIWNSYENERESYDSFLWKALEYSRSEAGEHDFRILHRLYVNREVGGQREFVVNPFFSTRTDSRTGDSSFRVLGFVYSSVVESGVETQRIFGIPISRSAAGPEESATGSD